MTSLYTQLLWTRILDLSDSLRCGSIFASNSAIVSSTDEELVSSVILCVNRHRSFASSNQSSTY